ncbi:unnamed protein product [Ilex paraguariensis]|uniref:Uncharacterized protein n=1 Tax=Ilex paraguariensis TaxID=185542 RepID=A0ABC8TGA5_9AQUA
MTSPGSYNLAYVFEEQSFLIEPVGGGAGVEDVSPANDLTCNVTQWRLPRKSITSLVVDFILKLLAWIYLLLPRLGRFFVKTNVDMQLENQLKPELADLSSREQPDSRDKKEDLLHPCLQRLQNLEALVSDLLNKPTSIPPEKENMLHESLDRIKSIEYDLQKTKRALLATASKQVELAVSLESLRVNSLNETNTCWIRSCKSSPRGT